VYVDVVLPVQVTRSLPLQKNIGANFDAQVSGARQLAVTVIDGELINATSATLVVNATELSVPVTVAPNKAAGWLPHPKKVLAVLLVQLNVTPPMVRLTGR
jgi:hypothetical protein